MDVKIIVVDWQGEVYEFEVFIDMNMNFMEVCKVYELLVKGICGGMVFCFICYVYVESDYELFEMGENEEDMFDQVFFVEDNFCLGCQFCIMFEFNGLKVQLVFEDEEVQFKFWELVILL